MAATYLTPGVYIEEQRSGSMPIAGVGTSVAAFIGFTEKYDKEHGDPTDPRGVKPQLVTNWPQYERIYGGFTKGAMLPFAVKGFFDNGGTTCFIVRIPSQRDAASNGNGHRPALELPTANTTPGLEGLKVEAIDAGAHLEVEVVPPPPPAEGQEPSQDYTLRVLQDGAVREEIHGLNFTKSPRVFERAVREQSKLITVSLQSAGTALTDLVPAPGRYPLQQPAGEVVAADVSPSDLEGSESERTGYQGLAIAKDVTMVAIPDLVTIATREDGTIDEEIYLSVQGKLVDWCQAGGTRMAILDTPPNLSATRALEWRTRLARDSAFAALYYPNVVVDNPLARPGSTNGERFVTVPPVGHVAGLWARTDATRGVWKAPANETVLGITRLENDVTDGEQSLLNPEGVNCIRAINGGLRVWGARTLSLTDPSWRYVNVRRLFCFVEESIRRGTQWAVFEPNNTALWGLVRRNITAFLLGLSEQGAFANAAGSPGFYVMCDERNNPPHSIDDGKLIVEVGIAPSKPAEFVIFRISQLPSGGSVSE